MDGFEAGGLFLPFFWFGLGIRWLHGCESRWLSWCWLSWIWGVIPRYADHEVKGYSGGDRFVERIMSSGNDSTHRRLSYSYAKEI